MAISGGAVYYSFPLFYKPLQVEFNWSRGVISAVYTVYSVLSALLAPLIGRMIDRYGAKRSIVTGAVVTGLGFAWLSLMKNLWSFYTAYIVIGLGMRGFDLMATAKIVSNWFVKRRGTALGIMASGFGVGGLLMAPVIGSYLIPVFGWRGAYLALALITWVLIIPGGLLTLKTKPSDIGLYPDGEEPPAIVTEAELTMQASKGLTLKMALRTSAFWLISIAFLTSNFGHMGIMQHQVNYLTDIGFSVGVAAASLGVVGFGSAVSKFGTGWLCDRMPAKYVASICFAFKVAAVIVIIMVKPTSPLGMLWLYAIFMGLGVGGWTAPQSILISDNFGLASYGAILGMVSLISGLGGAFSPLFAGYMYDRMQTYFWVFIIFLVLCAIAIPCMLAMRRPKSRLASSK